MSRTQKPTPSLRDFIEFSLFFVHKSLPLPEGFYWIFNISRTQKPTPPFRILLNFQYFSYTKACPSPRDFIAVFFEHKSLPLPYGFYWLFHMFRTQKATRPFGILLSLQYVSNPKAYPSLMGFIECSIFFVHKSLPLPYGSYWIFNLFTPKSPTFP